MDHATAQALRSTIRLWRMLIRKYLRAICAPDSAASAAAAAQPDAVAVRTGQTCRMEYLQHFDNPDLAADADARWVVKDEVVRVQFAAAAGELQSAVGVNRYAPGDALIAGTTGDRWCVSRARFDAKYRPEGSVRAGDGGIYRNRPVPILAKQIDRAFSVARCVGGDLLRGEAGDWLVQYAPGDFGIVARTRFAAVYRPAAEPSEP